MDNSIKKLWKFNFYLTNSNILFHIQCIMWYFHLKKPECFPKYIIYFDYIVLMPPIIMQNSFYPTTATPRWNQQESFVENYHKKGQLNILSQILVSEGKVICLIFICIILLRVIFKDYFFGFTLGEFYLLTMLKRSNDSIIVYCKLYKW